MIVRNAFSIPRRIGPSGHGGAGTIEHCRVFNPDDFESDLKSISFDILLPGSSIGEHAQQEEEIYFIIEGRGIAIVSGEEREVGPGDMVFKPSKDTHGIRNHSSQPLKVIAIGARVRSSPLESGTT